MRVAYLTLTSLLSVLAKEWNLLMPGIEPDASDLYLCKAFSVEELGKGSHFITGFKPHATQMTAHHMLLHGCETPGNADIKADVWNCGEMRKGSQEFGNTGPVCKYGYTVMYDYRNCGEMRKGSQEFGNTGPVCKDGYTVMYDYRNCGEMRKGSQEFGNTGPVCKDGYTVMYDYRNCGEMRKGSQEFGNTGPVCKDGYTVMYDYRNCGEMRKGSQEFGNTGPVCKYGYTVMYDYRNCGEMRKGSQEFGNTGPVCKYGYTVMYDYRNCGEMRKGSQEFGNTGPVCKDGYTVMYDYRNCGEMRKGSQEFGNTGPVCKDGYTVMYDYRNCGEMRKGSQEFGNTGPVCKYGYTVMYDYRNCGEMRKGSQEFGNTGPVCKDGYTVMYDYRNCGEMRKGSQEFGNTGPVCKDGYTVMYDYRNCGEMRKGSQEFGNTGPVCKDGYTIMYAWAKDAPALNLPEGVSFKIGDKTNAKYLVMQVHYMMALKEKDSSGITVSVTDKPTPKSAGVLLHATNGAIGPRSEANFDVACSINEDVEIHPFGFRTHTHKLGYVVSGWRVRQHGEGGPMDWSLIGKKNPQLPEMFYPVKDEDLVIRKGDAIAARCNMYNFLNEPVYIGSTGDDEMCNFYTMYWVEGENLVKDWQCASEGPPGYSWEIEAGLTNIPEEESMTRDEDEE